MSREKQIDEIACILASNCGNCTECDSFHKEINGIDACYHKYAGMIYDAGYRKQSEVAREIFADIEKIILKERHKCETFRSKSVVPNENRYFEGSGHSLQQVSYWITVLKKKYTEEQT